MLKEKWDEAEVQYKLGLSFIDQNTNDYWTAYANYAVVIAKRGEPEKANNMIIEAEQHGYTNGDACRTFAGIR